MSMDDGSSDNETDTGEGRNSSSKLTPTDDLFGDVIAEAQQQKEKAEKLNADVEAWLRGNRTEGNETTAASAAEDYSRRQREYEQAKAETEAWLAKDDDQAKERASAAVDENSHTNKNWRQQRLREYEEAKAKQQYMNDMPSGAKPMIELLHRLNMENRQVVVRVAKDDSTEGADGNEWI